MGLGGTTGRVRGGHGQGVQGPQAGCGRSSGDLLPVEWGRLPDPGQGLRAASPLCLWEECAAGAPAASWVRSLHPGPTASAAWTGHVPGSEGPGHSGGTHCAPGALGFGQDPLLSWRPLSAGDPSLGCRPQLLPSHSARTPAAHSSETVLQKGSTGSGTGARRPSGVTGAWVTDVSAHLGPHDARWCLSNRLAVGS